MIFNPGTTPTPSATVELAAEAIFVFVSDLDRPETDNLQDVSVERDASADGDGWFGFKLSREDRSCTVLMPGLLLKHTRNHPHGCGQRLYVDGNSWWWPFALNQVTAALRRPHNWALDED